MEAIKAAKEALTQATGQETQEVLTAYPAKMPAQHQSEPGLDSKMEPSAVFTKMQYWENGQPFLKEYVGSGKLQGKNALITGGDSGIGRSVAQMFAREGCDVSIVYLPEEQSDAEEVKKEIVKDGRQCLLLPFDLCVEANCENIVKQHVAQYGSIDVLVNNAARQVLTPDIAEIDLVEVEKTFRTNILSQFAITKFAVQHMKPGSTIVNSTSVGAFNGKVMAQKLDYSATKGAIATLTRSLAFQLAPKYIRVNAVAPGPIWTPINVNVPGQPAEATKNMMYNDDMVALRRIGHPAELGPAYVYLASPDSSYVTGSVMLVDGGM